MQRSRQSELRRMAFGQSDLCVHPLRTGVGGRAKAAQVNDQSLERPKPATSRVRPTPLLSSKPTLPAWGGFLNCRMEEQHVIQIKAIIPPQRTKRGTMKWSVTAMEPGKKAYTAKFETCGLAV